jgi:hypothetical protein
VAKTIVGSFDSFSEAQEVFRDLQQCGFSRDDISIVGNDARRQYGTEGKLPPDAPATLKDTGSGAATGAAAGGVLGGAAGLVVGLMGLAIPGIGPIVAAGPLAAALAGAGVGAVAGGLIGGLTGVGVSEEDAGYYAEAVRRGGALVMVRADDSRAEEAARIMRSHGAVDIERRAQQWREAGWERHDPAAQPYTVEQLDRERALYAGSIGATAGTAMPSGMDVPSMPGSDWSMDRDYFRRAHGETYGGTTGFEEYEPAYQYGWEAGSSDRYRGREWVDIEPVLRSDWERRYPDGGWERFKDAIRRGWQRTKDAIETAIPGDSDRDGR